MRHRTMRLAWLGMVLALVAGLAVESADAATLKHKQTGEVIKGRLTKQRVNKMNVFELEHGGTKFIRTEEWEVIEANEPEAETAGAETEAPVSETAGAEAEPADTATVVFVLPIEGPIMTSALVEGIERGLSEAKSKGAAVVVFHMDTPGGRVDLGDKLIQMIGDVDWAKTVAWIEGGDKRALSCGAYVCLATHGIYMAPGTTIGAATPFRQNATTGSAQVDEKMTSAFRARFRSLAQERGHPSAIADAMVDDEVSVIQVFVDGQQQIVTEEVAKQLEQEHEKDGKFKRGKTISKEGKIVTLTSKEALEYGVCKAIAETEDDLMKALGLEDCAVTNLSWLSGWVEKKSQQAQERFEKLRTAYNTLIQQARMTPEAAKRRDLLKGCAKALVEIEKMANDPGNDVHIPQEYINNLKAQLQAFYGASH